MCTSNQFDIVFHELATSKKMKYSEIKQQLMELCGKISERFNDEDIVSALDKLDILGFVDVKPSLDGDHMYLLTDVGKKNYRVFYKNREPMLRLEGLSR